MKAKLATNQDSPLAALRQPLLLVKQQAEAIQSHPAEPKATEEAPTNTAKTAQVVRARALSVIINYGPGAKDPPARPTPASKAQNVGNPYAGRVSDR